jgi:hypothetical protein
MTGNRNIDIDILEHDVAGLWRARYSTVCQNQISFYSPKQQLPGKNAKGQAFCRKSLDCCKKKPNLYKANSWKTVLV